MGRTPDGRLDLKQIAQVTVAVLALLGGGSGVYATTKREAVPDVMMERLLKLESWKDSLESWKISHGQTERESRAELTAALRENTKELVLFREAIVTQISKQAADIRIVESRVTALERRQEKVR